MLCMGILPIGFYNSPIIYIILKDYDTFRDFTMDRNKCSSPDLKPYIQTNVHPTSRSSGEEKNTSLVKARGRKLPTPTTPSSMRRRYLCSTRSFSLRQSSLSVSWIDSLRSYKVRGPGDPGSKTIGSRKSPRNNASSLSTSTLRSNSSYSNLSHCEKPEPQQQSSKSSSTPIQSFKFKPTNISSKANPSVRRTASSATATQAANSTIAVKPTAAAERVERRQCLKLHQNQNQKRL